MKTTGDIYVSKLADSRDSSHNYGIDVLRLILAFEVVLCHFWSRPNDYFIYKTMDAFRSVAAPTFFLLSFFLNSKYITANGKVLIRKRIWRLGVPFFFWGTVSWFVYIMLHYPMGKKQLVVSLFWQLLAGSAKFVNPPLWYLVVLCLLTLLYCLIFSVKKHQISIALLSGLFIMSYVLQYLGINARLFSSFPYESKYTLGRIMEMIPYATAGLFLWRLFGVYGGNRTWIIIGSIGVTIYALFPDILQAKGFGYSGINKLVGSVSTVMIFTVLPLNRLPGKIKKLLRIISAHTMGIYCMHYFMGMLIRRIGIFQGRNLILCLFIYLCCYFISFLISRIEPLKCLVD